MGLLNLVKKASILTEFRLEFHSGCEGHILVNEIALIKRVLKDLR